MNLMCVKDSFTAALPIMVGYVFLGVPCGILAQQVGLDALQAFLLSIIFYSGAGQFMIPNMWLAASPLSAIIASVSLVNSRQMLYSASLSRFCEGSSKRLSFLFAATVTDESFGVNLAKFDQGSWDVRRATFVNLFSMLTWAVSNAAGVLLGSLLNLPTALASFAMTSIFICLLFSQRACKSNIVAAVMAVVGVVVCKCVGLTGPAIFIGACVGILSGIAVSWLLGEKLK